MRNWKSIAVMLLVGVIALALAACTTEAGESLGLGGLAEQVNDTVKLSGDAPGDTAGDDSGDRGDMAAGDEGDDPAQSGSDDDVKFDYAADRCPPHEMVAQYIAELAAQVGEDPAVIESLFCGGYGLDEITLAYTLSARTGTTVPDIIAMLEGGMTWEQVLAELGITDIDLSGYLGDDDFDDIDDDDYELGGGDDSGDDDDTGDDADDSGDDLDDSDDDADDDDDDADDDDGDQDDDDRDDDDDQDDDDEQGDDDDRDDDDDDVSEALEDASLCLSSGRIHPVVERLADEYDVEYADVEARFCEGYGLGEIKLAYELAEAAKIDAADVFALREAGIGWGEIRLLLDVDAKKLDLDLSQYDDALTDEGVAVACDDTRLARQIAKLAEDYDADPDVVQQYVCDGANLGELKNAYKAAEDAGISVEAVLALRDAGLSWGELKRATRGGPNAPDLQELLDSVGY